MPKTLVQFSSSTRPEGDTALRIQNISELAAAHLGNMVLLYASCSASSATPENVDPVNSIHNRRVLSKSEADELRTLTIFRVPPKRRKN